MHAYVLLMLIWLSYVVTCQTLRSIDTSPSTPLHTAVACKHVLHTKPDSTIKSVFLVKRNATHGLASVTSPTQSTLYAYYPLSINLLEPRVVFSHADDFQWFASGTGSRVYVLTSTGTLTMLQLTSRNRWRTMWSRIGGAKLWPGLVESSKSYTKFDLSSGADTGQLTLSKWRHGSSILYVTDTLIITGNWRSSLTDGIVDVFSVDGRHLLEQRGPKYSGFGHRAVTCGSTVVVEALFPKPTLFAINMTTCAMSMLHTFDDVITTIRASRSLLTCCVGSRLYIFDANQGQLLQTLVAPSPSIDVSIDEAGNLVYCDSYNIYFYMLDVSCAQAQLRLLHTSAIAKSLRDVSPPKMARRTK